MGPVAVLGFGLGLNRGGGEKGRSETQGAKHGETPL
jgi:hypothetical protein